MARGEGQRAARLLKFFHVKDYTSLIGTRANCSSSALHEPNLPAAALLLLTYKFHS